MRLQQLPRNHALPSMMKNDIHSMASANRFQKLKQEFQSFMPELLDRRWALTTPDTKIHRVALSEQSQKLGDGRSELSFSIDLGPNMGHEMNVNGRQRPSFYVVRDDLLHPLVNGNKARKLDGLLPLLEDHSITDVVTCGGCQSAHAAAIAVSCAERGIRSHLLLRGEQPDIPTGYNLISSMFGNTIYVPRSLYAKREEMLRQNADLVAGSSGSVLRLKDILNMPSSIHESEKANYMSVDACGNIHHAEKNNKKVVIVNEGAGGATALLGLIRLVKYLSQAHLLGKVQPIDIVVDAGTGTTAVGLALGAICYGLPWEVTAVMLADTLEGYKQQEKRLISEFAQHYNLQFTRDMLNEADGIVHWVERIHPRKFGNVLKGEVEECQRIAQETGVLMDPVYTLAAWERAMLICRRNSEDNAKVVMIHTGGTLGMFGLAQSQKLITTTNSHYKSLPIGFVFIISLPNMSNEESNPALAPDLDTPEDPAHELAQFGAGCFWGVELAFQRLPGVTKTEVGYSQGHVSDPTYKLVCTGTTNHVEVVRVQFDPSSCKYTDLLSLFWSRHDPTSLNRQGGDVGTQYRSGIYYYNDEQLKLARESLEAKERELGKKVVTEILPAKKFYRAEEYHQQYLEKGGGRGNKQSAEKGCSDPIRCYG